MNKWVKKLFCVAFLSLAFNLLLTAQDEKSKNDTIKLGLSLKI